MNNTKRKLIIGIILKLVLVFGIITVLNIAVDTIGVSLSNDLAMQQFENTDMPYYFMRMWNMFIQFISVSELILALIFGGFIISDIYRYIKTKKRG